MKNRNVYIIGVQKCATSSLFDILKKTDQFDCSRIKEPHFYSLSNYENESIRKWYDGLFSKNSNFRLDGSTSYSFNLNSLRRIKNENENPLFIIIMRDPVERIKSAYNHMSSKIPSADKRAFD